PVAGSLAPCQFRLRFFIREVAEDLHSARILFRGDHAVLLIDEYSPDHAELARQQPVIADPDEQLPLRGEHLYPVLHRVGYPNVPVAVYCNSFWPGEITR